MLKQLFDKYKCDKGREKHHYYKEYEQYFESVKDEPINLLEIGTFKGSSTRAFHEYFPNGTIYTIDIFERTDPKDLDILDEPRVKWLKADSTNASLGKKIKRKWGDVKFDFIIDDGAHWPEANRLTFENCMPFIKEGGTYFVEDVWPMHKMKQTELSNPWLVKFPKKYDMLKHIKFMTILDSYNTIHYDRRKETRCGDTYIIAINNL
jgi:23S rRNA U2552 (ribose-2'-O)-methylase RlmE/FtsJ